MKNSTWTRNKHADGRSLTGRLIQFVTFGLLSVALAGTAYAGPREQAKRIHDRLAGVPPSDAVLQQLMEAEVDPGQAGTAMDAAYRAMDNPNFYNVTLKNFAAPWTNRDQNVFVPLNDYVALVVGMIRDDVPFNTLFSSDDLYIGPGSLPAYSNFNNDHYARAVGGPEHRHDDRLAARFAVCNDRACPHQQLPAHGRLAPRPKRFSWPALTARSSASRC